MLCQFQIFSVALFLSLLSSVISYELAVLSSCRHRYEFSKSIAYILGQAKSHTIHFVTDASCADTVKISNVETFSQEPWYNDSSYATGFLASYTNYVQDHMNEVVHSAESLQRLLEQKSLDLIIMDEYFACAAAVAEMHDIPVILMHNSMTLPPNVDDQYKKAYFLPNFLINVIPDVVQKVMYEAYMVYLRNLPDIRMAISVGNKCNIDLKTNISHYNLFHFWSSYPKVGSLLPSLLPFNEKTKDFVPIGLIGLVEKGRPKSNRMESFITAKDGSIDNPGYLYFTGEQELVQQFGFSYFVDAFSNQTEFKTAWTNISLPKFSYEFSKFIVTPLTAHSVMVYPQFHAILGTCSLDNILLTLHYEKILFCISMSYRDSPVIYHLSEAGVIQPLSYYTSSGALKDKIASVLGNSELRKKMMEDMKTHHVSQGKKGKALKDYVDKYVENLNSSWKKSAQDPVNHVIEIIMILMTFVMFVRFFLKSGRRIFGTGEKEVYVSGTSEAAKQITPKDSQEKKDD